VLEFGNCGVIRQGMDLRGILDVVGGLSVLEFRTIELSDREWICEAF
jgi:hypothetical protein